ncbi:hypothetical protein ElyMa_007055700 [Elysia marginata]|uniref:Uncharacterized protein n=1 Tax=Elysia marginata TaxID=1093978 RepID=A0AAV4JYP8_9GAST|nr:hypothetical protein ElyMa_007055700 [Elysia marginata]
MWSFLTTPESTISTYTFYTASRNFHLFLCVAVYVDAEISIGNDNDDSGVYYDDDFATHVHDDEDDEDVDKMSCSSPQNCFIPSPISVKSAITCPIGKSYS